MSSDAKCGQIIYSSPSLSNRLLSFRQNNESDYLRSTDADNSVKLKFTNKCDKNVFIFWINYEGKIRSESTLLKAKGTAKIGSFISHPFILSFCDKITAKSIETEVIGVYIPQNVKYMEHLIFINEDGKSIKSEIGEVRKNKTWTMAAYEKYVIEGFTVYFECGLMEKYGALLIILTQDLKKINELIPTSTLRILHATHFWLNDDFYYNEFKRPPESMCFHPSAQWLKENGNMTEKAECIEVYRVRDWIKDRGIMPMALLHELSHSLHWYIDYDRLDILSAYKAAKNAKTNNYQSIDHVLGGKTTAYAITNQMEYFAECTEAYFGLNDFYPFDRQQLKDYDKRGFDMIETIWNLNDEQLFCEHQKALKNRKENEEKDEEESELFEIDTSRIVSV